MNENKNQDYQEKMDPHYEALEKFCDSYLKAVLILVGLVLAGIGSTFFSGDKVLTVGVIVFLLGLFCNSFNGLVRKLIHVALTGLLLAAVTAYFAALWLGTKAKGRLNKTTERTKAMENDVISANTPAEEEAGEPEVFQRIVLDGDVDEVPSDARLADEGKPACAVSPADFKPKFNPLSAAGVLPADFIAADDFLDGDDDVFGVVPDEVPPPVQCCMDSYIPDDMIIIEADVINGVGPATNSLEESARPVVAKARRVSTGHLPNGARFVARVASNK